MDKACSQNLKKESVMSNILMDKSTGRKPPGIPKYRKKKNIRVDLKEIGVSVKSG
jgi:hypothetical protein